MTLHRKILGYDIFNPIHAADSVAINELNSSVKREKVRLLRNHSIVSFIILCIDCAVLSLCTVTGRMNILSVLITLKTSMYSTGLLTKERKWKKIENKQDVYKT